MKYLSVAEVSNKWNLSERSIRNYCAQDRIDGAYILKGRWYIPDNAKKPVKLVKGFSRSRTLINVLKEEQKNKISGGIHHKIQIELTYNSNHIEGSMLSHDQTRLIYETHSILQGQKAINVNDVIETANHFRCIDMIINKVNYVLTESYIKSIHATLKNGIIDNNSNWFEVGEYKKYPNEVGGQITTPPEEVQTEMKKLLKKYNSSKEKSLEDILDFHVRFERIHPFQDGNGRVGRLIMFKECLKSNIVPFIIDDKVKLYYYRGLNEWDDQKGYLLDTCMSGQDKFKEYLDYFRITY